MTQARVSFRRKSENSHRWSNICREGEFTRRFRALCCVSIDRSFDHTWPPPEMLIPVCERGAVGACFRFRACAPKCSAAVYFVSFPRLFCRNVTWTTRTMGGGHFSEPALSVLVVWANVFVGFTRFSAACVTKITLQTTLRGREDGLNAIGSGREIS